MFSGSQGYYENVIHRFSKQFRPSLSTILNFEPIGNSKSLPPEVKACFETIGKATFSVTFHADLLKNE
jgi:hypothetical protein